MTKRLFDALQKLSKSGWEDGEEAVSEVNAAFKESAKAQQVRIFYANVEGFEVIHVVEDDKKSLDQIKKDIKEEVYAQAANRNVVGPAAVDLTELTLCKGAKRTAMIEITTDDPVVQVSGRW